MERFAWKATVKEGKLEEYKYRHAHIWPEMKQVLKEAGISNYTIWNVGNELFGYFECEKGVAYAEKYQAESPVVDKWNEYMKDVMVMEMDPQDRCTAEDAAGILPSVSLLLNQKAAPILLHGESERLFDSYQKIRLMWQSLR